jgi:hypothetical protein
MAGCDGSLDSGRDVGRTDDVCADRRDASAAKASAEISIRTAPETHQSLQDHSMIISPIVPQTRSDPAVLLSGRESWFSFPSVRQSTKLANQSDGINEPLYCDGPRRPLARIGLESYRRGALAQRRPHLRLCDGPLKEIVMLRKTSGRQVCSPSHVSPSPLKPLRSSPAS